MDGRQSFESLLELQRQPLVRFHLGCELGVTTSYRFVQVPEKGGAGGLLLIRYITVPSDLTDRLELVLGGVTSFRIVLAVAVY